VASIQPLSLPNQVLAILRAQNGPAEVDYLIWRLREKGYFACRVRRAVRTLADRGVVVALDQQGTEISGSTLVQAAPRPVAITVSRPAVHPAQFRSASRLQQLLCSPLVGQVSRARGGPT
jgi:hypothetical protein